jgi:hypothetical protein
MLMRLIEGTMMRVAALHGSVSYSLYYTYCANLKKIFILVLCLLRLRKADFSRDFYCGMYFFYACMLAIMYCIMSNFPTFASVTFCLRKCAYGGPTHRYLMTID